MKARLPLNSKMKKRLVNELHKEADKRNEDNTRRLFKLFCVVLNSVFGFGKFRLTKLIMEVAKLIEQSKTDEIFWYHIDKKVIDQIGMQFDRENYEEWDK